MQFGQLKRRDFITLLGGAVAAWPLAAHAQQPAGLRRVGVLMNLAADDPQSQARMNSFVQGLQELGWTDGRNVRIETRWAAADPERFRKYAAELVEQKPDVLLGATSAAVAALQQETRTAPIVFAAVADPVGAGFVANLAHPRGNTTGFLLFDYGISPKWLELLKEIVPTVTRVAVLRDPSLSSGIGQLAAIQAVAPSFGVELTPLDVRDAGEIERGIADFARVANGGLIVAAGPSQAVHRALILMLAARRRLPAVYPLRYMVSDGGLISYGADPVDQFRRAAGYVDRILKGEKPADLPVQAPVKYELVVNLRTAKALGLTIPDSVIARADEVIE
jgi:putative ABC transport system substrate-binding protein